MKHINKLPGFILSVVFILLMVACAQPDDGAIRFGLSTAPVTLDPRYATDAVSARINRLIYQRLVDFDDQHRMVPSLAEWQQLTPLHYRFYLKKERRPFHNGGDLGAGDVKVTYDSVLDADNISPQRATLADIDHIEVIDNDTIDFHLHHADPLFPGRLVIGILPAPLIQSGHPFHESPVGSGGFRFIEWPAEDRLVMERITGRQRFEFITVKDSTVRVLKLLRGEIDIIQGDLPFELLDWLRGKRDIRVETSRGDTFTYLGFNMRDEVLGQLAVRQAIAHALDREGIIQYVLGGAARKAGSLLPPDHWSGHPGLSGVDYDPEQSRIRLRQAGFDRGHPLQISYKTSNNPLRVRLATIIQYQLRQVGIDVNVQSYDWGTFYGDIKAGRFQMFSLSWVGLNMPDIFRYAFHSTAIPPAGANRGRFSDPDVDKMIEVAGNSASLEQQAEIYRNVQAHLLEQLPYVPLWYEDTILARRQDISGYTLSANGDYDGLNNTRRLQ